MTTRLPDFLGARPLARLSLSFWACKKDQTQQQLSPTRCSQRKRLAQSSFSSWHPHTHSHVSRSNTLPPPGSDNASTSTSVSMPAKMVSISIKFTLLGPRGAYPPPDVWSPPNLNTPADDKRLDASSMADPPSASPALTKLSGSGWA